MIDNIYDLRRRNGLYVIISNKKKEVEHKIYCNAAVIIYLYYMDSEERYAKYIKQIPNWIDIYIVSSNKNLIHNMRKEYYQKNIFFKEKNNRGRDVSAFLIASREYILNYEYVCFVHDKKEKSEFRKKDTEAWIENLWGNTIGSQIYIENILEYMNSNKKMGLLCPIEPTDVYTEDNFWGNNYDNTIKLAKTIGINPIAIAKEKAPISLGTVFWARTKALEKILTYDWDYSDFVEEPMPDDGTISHAIERILPYVAQDAGYDVGTVMSKEYASKVIAELYDNWLNCGVYLRNKMGIRKVQELNNIEKKIDDIKKFCNKKKHIYIYGAGRFALDLCNLCKTFKIKIDGCVVTDINSGNILIKDLPVYELGVVNIKDCGIILAVNKSSQKEIINSLNEIGVHDIYIYRN